MTVFEHSISDPTPVDDWEKYSRGSKGGVDFCEERTPEQVIQYRRDHVHNTIFRWLRDGQRRIDNIISAKIKSWHKHRASYDFRTDKNSGWLVRHKAFEAKSRRKLDRIKFYMDKSKEIDRVIKNYENYTYEELCIMPDLLLYDDKNCRI